MNTDEIRLISPLDLRPTEEISLGRVREVIAMIVARQAWTQPICLERTTLAILDGHHRHAAAIQLGLRRVPVRVFAYEAVELASWRAEIHPTRDEVLRRARAGELYPPKTTRHSFEQSNFRIDSLQVLI
ncbi:MULTISPECIES: ParB N-terminal domain-containing protein [Methylobacterium]|uniref:ParB-like N-terminal domain-containing protein n=1 Tax=Methylobacterium thuringiense TaxID=1003091 RepID=A0ABQ4TR06_9HYPH|nr:MULTISPECIES: ParB N-terminal domain-containing protein [Methylobacterium]TXN20965.1 hypothetical protein FV217_16095 [Methylobacterium sp. WL9]GJE57057.1 hypothetical protein EKPJFOCH_3567 [Methylobacterium thuringiense]